MLTLAQWIARLTKGYIKFTGKKPDKLSRLKIKMEAGQKVRDQEKVIKVDFGKKKPWYEKKAGGGIAGMLGEPTYMDENHRVPFREAGEVMEMDWGEDPDELEEILKAIKQRIKEGLGKYQTGGRVPYKDGEFGKKENLPSGLKAEVGDPTPGWGLSDLVRRYFLYQKVLPGVGEETQKYLGEKFLNDLNAQGYSPKDFKAYIDEQFSESKADGGRIGFKLGGIDKMRRLFLQAMGAGAAGVGAAKSGLFGLLKSSKSAAVKDLTSVPIQNAEGMPAWFKPLVNRVIKEGEDITKLPPNKGGAWKEREIVHSAKLGENQGVKVSQDLDNQTITVEYQSADNMGGIDDAVRLEYKAAEVIEPPIIQGGKLSGYGKGVKTKPEFKAEEAFPHGTTGDYKDITMEGSNVVNKVDDLYSDTSALKQFGTGKDLSKKELAIAKQKQKRVNEINNDLGEQSQLLPDPPDYDDFAQGGRVPMWLGGGLGVGKGLLRTIMRHHEKTGTTGLTGSKMLELVNPKQFNKMLNRPEGIPAVAKEMIEKYIKEMKVDRLGAVEHSLGMAKKMKKSKDKLKEIDKITEKLTKEFTDKGMDKKMVKDLVDMFLKAKYPDVLKIKALPNITDEAILELENIGKNLATKGRKLNASGGLAGMLGE